MRNKIILTVALTTIATAAWAGYKQPAPVEIDPLAMQAWGDLTAVANSSNDVDFIGCGTRSFAASDGLFSYRWGFCQVSNTVDETIICFTEDPILLDEMRELSDRSFLVFSWVEEPNDLGDLTCTYVGSSKQSFYLDEIKKSKGK